MPCQVFTMGISHYGNGRRNLILNLWDHSPYLLYMLLSFYSCLFMSLSVSLLTVVVPCQKCHSGAISLLFIITLAQDVFNFLFVLFSFPPCQGRARSSNGRIYRITDIALSTCSLVNESNQKIKTQLMVKEKKAQNNAIAIF